MKKYSEKQKLKAVEAYLSGDRGLRVTAELHQVGFDSLRVWVAAYRAHGRGGLEAKARQGYDLQFKLQVLSRVRDEGLSYREAAAMFNIRRFDVIGMWERAYRAGGLAALKSSRQAEKSGMSQTTNEPEASEAGRDAELSRQELLQELQRLRMENAYLKKLEALVRDQSRSAPNNGRESCSS
jgi:transposase